MVDDDFFEHLLGALVPEHSSEVGRKRAPFGLLVACRSANDARARGWRLAVPEARSHLRVFREVAQFSLSGRQSQHPSDGHRQLLLGDRVFGHVFRRVYLWASPHRRRDVHVASGESPKPTIQSLAERPRKSSADCSEEASERAVGALTTTWRCIAFRSTARTLHTAQPAAACRSVLMGELLERIELLRDDKPVDVTAEFADHLALVGAVSARLPGQFPDRGSRSAPASRSASGCRRVSA